MKRPPDDRPEVEFALRNLREMLLKPAPLSLFQAAGREDIVQGAIGVVTARYADEDPINWYRIARRIACHQAYARLRRFRFRETSFPNEPEDRSGGPSAAPDATADLREFRGLVIKSLADVLSPEERAIILRGVVGTEGVGEFAASLGLSTRAGYRYLRSALSKLHFELREDRDYSS